MSAIAEPQPSVEDDADEISLIDLAITLAKHKWLIMGITATSMALGLAFAFSITPQFTATAKILLPQQQQSSAAALMSQALGGAAGLASSALGLKNPGDQYVALLQSRRVALRLIEQFKLGARYETKTMDGTVKRLASVTKIASGKDGTIAIEVEDPDPKFAAQLANAYVPALDSLMQSLAVTETSQRRLFFEKQLQVAHEQLAQAEDVMKSTQKKTGLIDLTDQAKAGIQAVAALRAQIGAVEVELAAMGTYATANNPDYIRAQAQLDALRTKLRGLEGRGPPSVDDAMLPTARGVPETGLVYTRALRELKYRETLFELLAKQYEMARLDEARDAAVIQVLDPATPPDHKSKPKRAMIGLLAGVAGLFVSILIAFLREAGRRQRQDPAQAARLDELKRYLWGKRRRALTQ